MLKAGFENKQGILCEEISQLMKVSLLVDKRSKVQYEKGQVSIFVGLSAGFSLHWALSWLRWAALLSTWYCPDVWLTIKSTQRHSLRYISRSMRSCDWKSFIFLKRRWWHFWKVSFLPTILILWHQDMLDCYLDVIWRICASHGVLSWRFGLIEQSWRSQ